jgi:hypothetical protein
MKKLLYANGDSFTFGMECLGDRDRREENKDLAYPVELGRLLGIDTVINAAYCGAPNEFIFRKTLLDLLELEATGTDPKDVFVVVGWSSVCRGEIYLKDMLEEIFKEKKYSEDRMRMDTMAEYVDFGTGFLNPGFKQGLYFSDGTHHNLFEEILPFFLRYVWNDNLEFEKWFVQQQALEGFLHSKGYEFVFFNAVHPFSEMVCNEVTKALMNNLSKPNYYFPEFFSFANWVDALHAEKKRVLMHPAPEVHRDFAKLLYDFIVENKLIQDIE